MKRNELIKCKDKIFRILTIENDRALVIDCSKTQMPIWVDLKELNDYERIENTIYIKGHRGGKKNLDLLLSDLNDFYQGLETFRINKSRLALIMRGKYINVYDILSYLPRECTKQLHSPILCE